MDTSFVPNHISERGEIWLKSFYVSVAITCVATFIIGIVRTENDYVLISVSMALGVTICGCLFTRCHNRCYHEPNNNDPSTPYLEYSPLQKKNTNQSTYISI